VFIGDGFDVGGGSIDIVGQCFDIQDDIGWSDEFIEHLCISLPCLLSGSFFDGFVDDLSGDSCLFCFL
jgi:hypothetical protein